MALKLNTPAPTITGKAFWLGRSGGEIFDLSPGDFQGKKIILAFYPGDFTPVCTVEMCDFGDNLGVLNGLNAQVVGISTDPIEKHATFAKKYKLDFPLVADTDKKIGEAYGVAGNFLMPSHKRALFILDEKGNLVWKKVELSVLFRTEVKEVARALKAL